MRNDEAFNIIVCGVGGQGNVLASHLLARACLALDYKVTIGESFGMSQRGGSVMSHVRISSQSALGPLIPRGKADIILGLEPMEALRILACYGNSGCSAVLNDRRVLPILPEIESTQYLSDVKFREVITRLAKNVWVLPATDMAIELGAAVMANIVILGALVGTGLLPITEQNFERTLGEHFSPAQLTPNIKAFRAGIQSVR